MTFGRFSKQNTLRLFIRNLGQGIARYLYDPALIRAGFNHMKCQYESWQEVSAYQIQLQFSFTLLHTPIQRNAH